MLDWHSCQICNPLEIKLLLLLLLLQFLTPNNCKKMHHFAYHATMESNETLSNDIHCHKLWIEICEIRQFFKDDLIKFFEVFTKITLELPQNSQTPLTVI